MARCPRPVAGAVAVALLLVASGCGNDAGGPTGPQSKRPAAVKAASRLNGADAPRAAEFPKVAGRTLQQVADGIGATGTRVGLAGTVYTTGTTRLAFGVLDDTNKFVYGPTAVYLAPSADHRARGPIVTPADVLVTEPAFRSQQAATETDPFAAIYHADVRLDKTGSWAILIVTKVGGRLLAAASQLKVTASSPIPAVGSKPPPISTDTVAKAGSIQAVDTRRPTSDMHTVDFKDVIGKKPVALLFATPQLCQSRVCGPVVDIALQLEQRYGKQMQFIHQEVYVDNEINKGYRAPLKAFHLQTEPWLFTFDRHGRIAARLEGSFGLDEFQDAVKAALR
jgi:hypothetical protein